MLRRKDEMLPLNNQIPASPGCFALPDVYENFVVVCDRRCPAQYVNDARDTNPKLRNNVRFVLANDVRAVCMSSTEGPHQLLQAQALVAIPAHTPLCFDYGQNFWEETKHE